MRARHFVRRRVRHSAHLSAAVYAQRYTSPSTAALLSSFEPVVAAILGVLLRERMSIREILGCLVVFSRLGLLSLLPAGRLLFRDPRPDVMRRVQRAQEA